MQIVSSGGDSLHEMSKPISGEKKNIFSLSSDVFVQGVAKVNVDLSCKCAYSK